MSKLLLICFAMTGGTLLADAAVNAVTPSTNDINRTNGWAHFDVVDTTPGIVVVNFVSTRSFGSYFEYRIDNAPPTSLTNYNLDVTDGLWPFVGTTNETKQMTFNVTSSLEIRMVFGAETDERFDWTSVDVIPPIPTYTCSGFQPPMDKTVSLKAKSNRVLPFKLQVLDPNGVPLGASDIAAPVIQISYDSAGGTDYVDFSGDILSNGKGDEGNQFTYDSASQTWQFNLSAKSFSASGAYLVEAVSGDSSAYALDNCSAVFVIQ